MEKADPRPASAREAQAGSVLRNRHFLRLWLAQAVSQTAQQAIMFGMIIVVERVTHSATAQGIAILATIIPGVIFGLVAGVFVDRLNKKLVLVTTNLLRVGVVLCYLLYDWSIGAVFLANFVFVAISQFFGPAEAATIPALVARDQLMAANALFNLTATAAQLVGIVLLAPALIKLLGAPATFIILAALYAIAAILVAGLPSGDSPARTVDSLRTGSLRRVISIDLGEAWLFITSDPRIKWSILYITLMSSMMLVLAALGPRYLVTVLGTQPEDAAYMFAPAGIAIFAGTLLVSRLRKLFGVDNVVAAGLFAVGVALLLVAFFGSFQEQYLTIVGANASGPQGLILPLLMIAALLGLGFAMTIIPSQTILMERAPAESRGRIFAALFMMCNVAAILPLVAVGSLADLIGASNMMGVLALSILYVAVAAVRRIRAAPRRRPAPAAGP